MLTIGKVAKAAGVSTDTLRYYERRGLLAPAGESAGGYRLYDGEAVRRLRFIRHAKACGFTLEEIQELITLQHRKEACCGNIQSFLTTKKLQIEHRIRLLHAMSAALDDLLAQAGSAALPAGECPIIAQLETAVRKEGP